MALVDSAAGVAESSRFINNNGNLTFNNPQSTFTPFTIADQADGVVDPKEQRAMEVDTDASQAAFGAGWVWPRQASAPNTPNTTRSRRESSEHSHQKGGADCGRGWPC